MVMRYFTAILMFLIYSSIFAQKKTPLCVAEIPDSIKAVAVLSDFKINTYHPKKLNLTMIRVKQSRILRK
jgi:hypothetical protein